MALLSFPGPPLTNGQLYPVTPVVGQSQYRWDSTNSTWVLEGAATAVIAGTYGDANNVGQFTVDTQGRITFAQNVPTNAPIIVAAPTTQSDPGAAGEVAYDAGYWYWHDGTDWQRVAAEPPGW